MVDALSAAARRGVEVRVVADGFGSMAALPRLQRLLGDGGVQLDGFRPLDRWAAWLQPSQLRRLHHKLCVGDEAVAFVGGINLIDDRVDRITAAANGRGWILRSNCAARGGAGAAAGRRWPRAPAWATSGAARSARWRAAGGRWPTRCSCCARLHAGRRPAMRRLRYRSRCAWLSSCATTSQRRHRAPLHRGRAHRARHVGHRLPLLYPRRAFRRSRAAAQRGVRVRLLMQGKTTTDGGAGRAVFLTTNFWSRACAASTRTPASCTPRWRWSTTTGPRSAAPTSTRCRCCST